VLNDKSHLDTDLADLRQSLAGTVLVADDDGYEAARRCFNALVDRRPAVIVRCAGGADVATAFAFARTHDFEVAVRGGGHNPAGHCTCDGGLVIDLSAMRAVEANAEAGVARAQGGATWLDFDSATQELGFVTPGGVVGSTGVCGLALGGGIGHLTAQHGLTCDNLVGAELVTPNGEVVRASADENAELLWALRGGGGNFGVATRLEFRLHRLSRVVGGRLVYRGDGVRDALRRFRDLAAAAPRELSCQAVLGVDESRTATLLVAPSYTGSHVIPQELRTLLAAPALVERDVRMRSYLDQQRLFDSPYGENRHYWKGHFVRELPDELLDVLLANVVALGRAPSHVLFESLHGAPNDVDSGFGALGFRHAAFNLSATAVWRTADLDEEHIAWARATAAAMEPWSLGGGYVNYMQADEPIERVRAAFGDAAFERLRALKVRYDPANVLRRNQNIPPLGA
jgi:FAD/FMN-containing dehydrogenase